MARVCLRTVASSPMLRGVLLLAQGENFEAICKMTDIFEGSIIRATRRLDELMKELASAAQVASPTAVEYLPAAPSVHVRSWLQQRR